MKIAVALPSYRNPIGLIAGIKNLFDLAERPNDLTFYIGLDSDDEAGRCAVEMCAAVAKIYTVLYPLDLAHSDMWNLLCAPDSADFYVLHNDDSVCVTPRWDSILAEKCATKPVIFWNDVNNPLAAGSCIVNNDWLKACGYVLPIYFPFWFGDTWLDELRTFVSGEYIEIENDLKLYVPHNTTTGMKDLDFWWGFFNAARPLRIAKAWDIFTKLGYTHLNEKQFKQRARELSAFMRQRDQEHKPRIPMLEKGLIEMGDKKLARHAKCRALADVLLAENNLQLWGDL